MHYTVEIFKQDRRTKTGERLHTKWGFEADSAEAAEARARAEYPDCRLEVFETWVTRTSAYDSTPFRERYDTPRACSPASELYWSM